VPLFKQHFLKPPSTSAGAGIVTAQLLEQLNLAAANGSGFARTSGFDLSLAREAFTPLGRPLESKGDRNRISCT